MTQGVHLARWADYYLYLYRTQNRQGATNTSDDWGGAQGVDKPYHQTPCR